jgi:transketolase
MRNDDRRRGSEVQLCLRACEELTSEGAPARVVSMPCWELFDRQGMRTFGASAPLQALQKM